MNKKQFKALSVYEKSFDEADCGYYRALLRKDVDEMATIYEELGYTISSKNCNRCILAMLKNLSKEYKTYKNKTTKKDETPN